MLYVLVFFISFDKARKDMEMMEKALAEKSAKHEEEEKRNAVLIEELRNEIESLRKEVNICNYDDRIHSKPVCHNQFLHICNGPLN